MIRLLLIADDFTGALDTGIRFAEYGAATRLLTGLPDDDDIFRNEESEVLVLDAETRHLPPGEAYRIVYYLVRRARKAGVEYIYKKTDSALRGNIGSELQAALEASGENFLAFLPAFPGMNRVTVDGIHYINGVPISCTEFGQDPFEPVRSSRVVDLFSGGDFPVRLFKRQDVYRTDVYRATIGIFDSVTKADLYRIARHLKNSGQLGVMAGCAGFAGVLPEVIGLQKQAVRFPRLGRQLLIACGSMNPITRRQIEYGETIGYQRVVMTPEQQLKENYLESAEGKRWLDEIDRLFEISDVVMIDTGASDRKQAERCLKEQGVTLEQARVRIAGRIGEVLRELLRKNSSRTTMVIGGDTLMGFVSRSGCREIVPVCEVEAGTVLSSMEIGGQKIWVITKSGGFGKRDLFRSLVEKIEKQDRFREGKEMAEQERLMMPGTVYYGEGAVEKIKEAAKGHRKAVIFTDAGIRASGLTEQPEKFLLEEGLEVEILDQLFPEPTCRQAQDTVDAFRQTGADLIVAVGGGSVMDLAKLASVCAGGDVTVRELLEEPLKGKKQVTTVMIPTTAGTGSEATPNSIVAVPELETKIGIVNPGMIPDTVILDGTMIKRLPRRIAASTGIDALAHAIECYTSRKANPFSNLFAMEALKLIFRSLIPACEDPEAIEAKNNMLLAAFYAGAAITASGTTAVHALAYPLGGKYHIAHGISNAIMLLPVMRFNEPACQKELAEIYDAMGQEPGRTVGEKSAWVLEQMEKMIKRLEIPSDLSQFGVKESDLEELAASGMKVQRLLVNNRRPVTLEDAKRLYREVIPKKTENRDVPR